MASDETISKGDDWYEVRIQTIVQTHKIFLENLAENPDHKSTVDMETYCRDVGMLLNMLNKAGEQLNNKKRIII